MDNFKIIYKILKTLEKALDRADFDSVAVDKDGKPLEFIHDAVEKAAENLLHFYYTYMQHSSTLGLKQKQ